jgi:hypothetical protein
MDEAGASHLDFQEGRGGHGGMRRMAGRMTASAAEHRRQVSFSKISPWLSCCSGRMDRWPVPGTGKNKKLQKGEDS